MHSLRELKGIGILIGIDMLCHLFNIRRDILGEFCHCVKDGVELTGAAEMNLFSRCCEKLLKGKATIK